MSWKRRPPQTVPANPPHNMRRSSALPCWQLAPPGVVAEAEARGSSKLCLTLPITYVLPIPSIVFVAIRVLHDLSGPNLTSPPLHQFWHVLFSYRGTVFRAILFRCFVATCFGVLAAVLEHFGLSNIIHLGAQLSVFTSWLTMECLRVSPQTTLDRRTTTSAATAFR